MLNLECKTALAPEEVLEELKRSFGKGGLGLEVKEENPTCITFEGGGGYITATLCEEKGKTRVDLATQEWDYQVQLFRPDWATVIERRQGRGDPALICAGLVNDLPG